MSISSAITTGLQGVQTGLNRIGIAGSRISTNIDDAGAMAASAVDQMSGQIQAKAATNIIKAADEMLGSIIDVRA